MTTQRIDACFKHTRTEKRSALVAYVMGCDPDFQTSLDIVKGLPKSGVDIIELGMAFSDPMADGPAIQAAGKRALTAGASVAKTLQIATEFRNENTHTPIILMGYYNPVWRYGLQSFVEDAISAGVDGVILVDLSPEEESEFVEIASPAGLSLIKLTAPTTNNDRAQKVFKTASGFVYYISVAGITGQKSADIDDIRSNVDRLRQHTTLPIAVGFGIKTPQQAADIGSFSDAVVVGSAFVKRIEANIHEPENAKNEVLELAEDLSQALRNNTAECA